MAEKIKKFFARKKTNQHFKQAGTGRRLNDEPAPSTAKQNQQNKPAPPRQDMTEERRLAAQAALLRLQDDKRRDNPSFNTSQSAIKAHVKRELEMQRKLQAESDASATTAATGPVEVFQEVSAHLAVSGVYFRCPFISEEVLSKEEWRLAIKTFLYEQLIEEPGLTSCLIIQSCNVGRERIDACVETLCKYLENILAHPNEEKYYKIRMSNKVFCEKVQSLEGSLELLNAAGFREQEIENDGNAEKYLVFNPENIESSDVLTTLVEAMRSAEPLPLELDRNRQVLLPAQAANKTDLPQAFYSVSAEEYKKEQALRAEALEKNLMLRTKAMREKDELRELRRYKYALLRIRFPDDTLLQGTFSVYDKVSDVFNFVKENLERDDLPFVLISPNGDKLIDELEKTLIDVKLVPAIVLNFNWHPSIAPDMEVLPERIKFIKADVMSLFCHDNI